MRLFLFPLFPVVVVFVQLATTPLALAVPIEHPGGYPFPSDERVKQKVKVDLHNVDNEEFLMTFAKAANLNILVDATEAPADALPFDIKHENSIENLALYFAEYRAYTVQRFASDTLLFWPQSDKKALSRQLFEANKERWTQQLADSLPPQSTIRAALLREYFEKQLGWNGQWEGVKLRVKVKDLPPELRSYVLSDMNAQIAFNVTHIDRPIYRLRDEFWQTAKLSVRSGFNYQKMAPASTLMLNDKRLNPLKPDAIVHPSDISMDIGELVRRGR